MLEPTTKNRGKEKACCLKIYTSYIVGEWRSCWQEAFRKKKPHAQNSEGGGLYGRREGTTLGHSRSRLLKLVSFEKKQNKAGLKRRTGGKAGGKHVLQSKRPKGGESVERGLVYLDEERQVKKNF